MQIVMDLTRKFKSYCKHGIHGVRTMAVGREDILHGIVTEADLLNLAPREA